MFKKSSHLLKQNSNSDNFSDTLHHHLSSSIFPQWYGVEWDYNGYTNDPSEGQIACGYFVSTTLKHIGFNLNRYDLAKQYSLSIVKSLDQDFRKFKSIEPTLEFIDSQVDQLYVVGLSNHVGFLSKEKGKIYFVHSNYMEPVAVEKELASESEALRSSNVFVLGKISHNEALNEKYKKKTKIDILD